MYWIIHRDARHWWDVRCGVWHMRCEMWVVTYEMWDVGCEMSGVRCETLDVTSFYWHQRSLKSNFHVFRIFKSNISTSHFHVSSESRHPAFQVLCRASCNSLLLQRYVRMTIVQAARSWHEDRRERDRSVERSCSTCHGCEATCLRNVCMYSFWSRVKRIKHREREVRECVASFVVECDGMCTWCLCILFERHFLCHSRQENERRDGNLEDIPVYESCGSNILQDLWRVLCTGTCSWSKRAGSW